MIDSKRDRSELYLCHEYKEKKRCPKCGLLTTKKKGYIYSKILSSRGIIGRKTQRFYCKSCGISFTNQGYNKRQKTSQHLKEKAVSDYVTTKNSLGEVGKRYNITKSAILSWLPEISSKYRSIYSIHNAKLWSGIIQIDGKELKIKGVKHVLLVGSDATSKIPIHYELVKTENKECVRCFIKNLIKHYPLPIKGIVSDFGRGKCFVKLIQELFPNTPHQVCLVHFMRYINLFLPRTKKSQYYWRNSVLKWIIKKVIMAPTRKESLQWMDKFIHWIPFFRASYHKRFIRSLITNYDLLTQHYEHTFLVTNTNVIENINRQIARKLKNLDGFKSSYNSNHFLHIWFSNFTMNIIINRPS